MQQDTRRLTVARDHLQSAYEEITRAIGLSERSMAEQAARRALDHVGLVVKRLQDEQMVDFRSEAEAPSQRALSCAQHAWQCLHDALNDWEMAARSSLDHARLDAMAALDAVDAAEHVRRSRDAVHG
jgi:hypothetical protein